MGVNHGFLPLRICLGGRSSSADHLPCSFHCHSSVRFPFQWLSFHNHRDMSSAEEKRTSYVCALPAEFKMQHSEV